MHAIVTGAAGFIGSHVTARLLEQGHSVLGLDALTPYYDPAVKRSNLEDLGHHRRFEFERVDLRRDDLVEVVGDADVIYHLAAQPGVRGSWERGFEVYAEHNVLATQRLLEAARMTGSPRVVYASSSSVYGNATSYPCSESDLTQPYSPYGVTKMAAEQLCTAYAENFGLPTASLRYFTVFGPRQRPEMAISRMIESAGTGTPFPLFGDGSAVRDFTFVGDIARATVDAGLHDVPTGAVMNVGGGSPVSVEQLLEVVGDAVGAPVPVERHPVSPGDVRRTGGDTTAVRSLLEWEPRVSLEDGIRAQAETQLDLAPQLLQAS
jgi:UDP-glucuronate 4-epimerase